MTSLTTPAIDEPTAAGSTRAGAVLGIASVVVLMAGFALVAPTGAVFTNPSTHCGPITCYLALLALAGSLVAVGIGGLTTGRLARSMSWSAVAIGTALGIGVALAGT